ncbi:hypothetical protein ACLOJK_006894 [Asimina triloba]
MEGGLAPTSIFMEEPELPVCLEVHVATFGEPSLSKNDEEIFWRPFNIEGRALNILGDLAPVKSRAVRKSVALALQELSDGESIDPVELILRDLLSHVWEELYDLERWIHFING